ncbi:Pin3 protein [Pichia kluyveri]|uniref:Pin3 protein n=1 Tax=Pichia kluyveri TaxID=36015 RepID=A0AAV5R837_PICKL|nr:Pin3 protein [Pichia kluyveri]
MSATINRSLTTIKTELEFLSESGVITESLCDHIISLLPDRYVKGMPISDLKDSSNTISNTNTKPLIQLDDSDREFNNEKQVRAPPPSAPIKAPPVELYEALYNFTPQQSDDLELRTGDKVIVTQKLSNAWWKGSVNGKSGVFPANYVTKYDGSSTSLVEKERDFDPVPQQSSSPAPSYYSQQPPQQYSQPPQQQQPPYYQQQPAPAPYMPYQSPAVVQQAPIIQAQPQQVVYQQQPQQQSSFSKFGSKLGDAAIFGAGATIGSDLVNAIF